MLDELFIWRSNVAGAYYYYITEPGKTYEDTLIDVYNYAKDLNIPYRLTYDPQMMLLFASSLYFFFK